MTRLGLRGWRLDLTWSLLLAMVVLGPLWTSAGYVLHGDLVFVPDQPWKPAWLGLDGQVPRSVPMDALVWLATTVLPGWIVERLALAAALVLAGVGAGRLVASYDALPRLAAITFFVWNPWVYERLGIGQWALVAGYACLPWVARAAARVRDEPGRWGPLAAWLAVASVCGPSSGLLAVATATGVVVWAGLRRVAVVLALGLVGALPWLVPALLVPGGVAPSAGAYAAFAPVAESGAGPLTSLFSMGGIWKTSVVPGERTSTSVVVLAGALTLVAMLGWRRAARMGDRREAVSLAVVGGTGLLLAGLTTVAGVASALDHAAAQVPGLAMFRDSHRLVALLGLACVPGLAAAVAGIRDAATQGREALVAVAGLVVVAPVLLLPTMAWGLGGELQPTRWPDEWQTVGALIDEGDRTVVLPWAGSYRGFAWNDHQASLDPTPRALPGEVLIDDRIIVGDRVLSSESAWLGQIGGALDGVDPAAGLRQLGVRWVLVHHGLGQPDPPPPGRIAHTGTHLTLIDLGEPEAFLPARPAAWAVLGGDLITIAVMGAGLFRYYRRVR